MTNKFYVSLKIKTNQKFSKLYYITLSFTTLLILGVVSPIAFAQTESQKIIDQCQTLYPEFETLGKAKFYERYMHQPNIRKCLTLYSDIAWFSTTPDRTEQLIAILDKPITQRIIRDRANHTDTIPQWIKSDTIRWLQGKDHDSVFSYGLRYLVDAKTINAPNIMPDHSGCLPAQICISKDDFIKYSIKDSQTDDVKIITHTFGTPGKITEISSIETTKQGKRQYNFHIDSVGLVGGTEKYYQFVHKTPIELGMTIASRYEIQAQNQIVFSFKDQQREAVIAWDKTKQYQEVIDKKTGIVLSVKYHDRINKTEWSAELTNTNAFSNDIEIENLGIIIPSWVKEPVKWWTDGKITDSEYLNCISYLLKNKIMQI